MLRSYNIYLSNNQKKKEGIAAWQPLNWLSLLVNHVIIGALALSIPIIAQLITVILFYKALLKLIIHFGAAPFLTATGALK